MGGSLTALGSAALKLRIHKYLVLALCMSLYQNGALVGGGIWKAVLEGLNGMCRSCVLGWPGCAPSWDLSLKLFPKVPFFPCLPALLLLTMYSRRINQSVR